MRLFGFEITRSKELRPIAGNTGRGGWFNIVGEPFAGAWQRNVEINQNLVPTFHAVFACMTLIAADICKLRVKYIRKKGNIWEEDDRITPKSAVLRQPNQFQNPKQFWESWVLSKLMRGNTYVLKGRDPQRNVVSRLWVLDPLRCRPLVSQSGDVFYELDEDNLAGRTVKATVPASEIIHDRFNCIFHPLVGLSPLYAAALAAQQGLNIQRNSANFFGNRSIPGGILTAPTTIPDETAQRLKREWSDRYSGENAGKTAVLGDGLEFKAIGVTAEDAQLLEQAKATAEWVCSAFHVPPYKIGVGPMPAYNNIQALNVEYYSQCLQRLIEDAEACLDFGLEFGPNIGAEFDLEGLLRMDTVSQVLAIKDAVSASVMSPNEGRAKLNLPPVPGGESPLSQQQYYSLEALGKRDAQDDPFAPASPPPAPEPEEPEEEEDNDDDDGEEQRGYEAEVVSIADEIRKRALGFRRAS